MTHNHDKTTPGQTGALTFELELAHAPEKVWRALTDPELLAEWLLPAVGFTLQPGAAFALTAPPQPGWDGLVHGEMIDAEPHKHLSYRWVVGELHTIVTFTLTPTAMGTHLTLVQAGFKTGQEQNFAGARYGWRMMSDKLIEALARLT